MKLCAEFREQDTALAAHRALIEEGIDPENIEIRSPYPLSEEAIPPHRIRPFRMRFLVKNCWFIGGIAGFSLAAFSQISWPIYTSGHQVVPVPIDMLITYESAMITGLITTTIFFFMETRPFSKITPPLEEDIPVARGNIALVVEGQSAVDKARKILDGKGARTIVTYAFMALLLLSTLTGCEMRMREQPSIKSTQAASVPQPPGSISMPLVEAQEYAAQVPIIGYLDLPDIQKIEDTNNRIIPKDILQMKNPVPADAESIGRGSGLFENNCSFCHGHTARGDGKVGELMKPRPPALIEPKVAALSDGAMFWKITMGPNTMPPFANRLSIKERFDVINFVRSLQKAAGGSGAGPVPGVARSLSENPFVRRRPEMVPRSKEAREHRTERTFSVREYGADRPTPEMGFQIVASVEAILRQAPIVHTQGGLR